MTMLPIAVLRRAALLALLSLLPAFPLPAAAQDASTLPQTVRVGFYEHPPFVMRDASGAPQGMAIDLWNGLAGRLGFEVDYVGVPNLRDLVNGVAAGDFDAAVTNLTVTRERAERMDFTHPWFDAGLRIMVRDTHGTGVGSVIEGLRASGHLRAYGWIVAVILAATVVLTVFDRRFDKHFPQRWRDGFAESFYTVMSVATSGKPPSRKNLFGWLGRIWQGIWLVCGIAVLAYVTSSVTSVMTTLSLTGQINSVGDLPGRPVGVFAGSVSETYARDNGFGTRSFNTIDDAAAALLDGRVDAVIGDAPVLEYYDITHPQQSVMVVGAIFEPDKYAFGLQPGSPLTRALTVELIGAHENGEIEELRSRYFGDRR